MRLLWWTNAYTLMCFCLLFLVSLRLAFSSCVTALFSLGLFWGLPRSHRLSSHSRLNAFVIQTKLGPQNLQECCHKLAGETWVSITHNCLWATVVLEDMIYIKSSRLLPGHLHCRESGVSSLTAYLPPQWLQWLQLGVTFSQVVWLIGCWLVSASHK